MSQQHTISFKHRQTWIFFQMIIAGLMVSERNWLDVYPYTNWGGNANLPVFQVGQTFQPAAIDLKEVCTGQNLTHSNLWCARAQCKAAVQCNQHDGLCSRQVYKHMDGCYKHCLHEYGPLLVLSEQRSLSLLQCKISFTERSLSKYSACIICSSTISRTSIAALQPRALAQSSSLSHVGPNTAGFKAQ